MYGALATIPLIALGTIYHQSFWLSAILSFLSILFSGSYFSPTITMMQNSTDRENSGNVVSIYTFVTAIAQTIAPLIFNILANFYGAQQKPQIYGYLISGFITFGYSIASIFYWKAGK